MDIAAQPGSLSDIERAQRSITVLEEQQLGAEFQSLSLGTRKRRLVLFFGRATFADNTKYLYLQALSHPKNYDVIWCSFDGNLIETLTRSGLPCVHLSKNIDHTIDLLLHAAVAVFCVNPNESLVGSYSLNACLAGARKLQLWHGVSVKHLLLRLVPHLGVREMSYRRAFFMASQADHVLSTASIFDEFWRQCFGCRRLVRAGLPRNEVLLRDPSDLELIGAELTPEVDDALRSGRKNVLVVPTWQRGHQTYVNDPDFFAKVMMFGKTNKVNFFFKMHPTYFSQNVDTRKKTDGFYLLNPGTDTYPLMRRFDALVTDYSSIMFDFLITNKPVLSLDLCKDEHQRFEPDFSLVPDVEFRHKFTKENFEAQLQMALYDDHRAALRQEMTSKIFETDPARSSELLLNLIDRLVEAAVASDFTVDHCAV